MSDSELTARLDRRDRWLVIDRGGSPVFCSVTLRNALHQSRLLMMVGMAPNAVVQQQARAPVVVPMDQLYRMCALAHSLTSPSWTPAIS
jgi:hypothetical protein